MNILHVIAGLPKAAGTSVFAGEIASQQAADGHNVAILVKLRCAIEHPVSAAVRIITKDELSFVQPSASNLHPQIVHIHALWDPWLSKMVRRFRKQGAKIVWSTHGMTAPWSLRHKWWKKWLPWYLYQLPDLKSAALIHCTTELEAEWNRALGFGNVFVAPLGTTLPSGRLRPEVEVDGGFSFDRRAMAEKKVEEWLVGVDDAAFDEALEKLVEEKTAVGEYVFDTQESKAVAIDWTRKFFAEFSQKLIPLSDGRIVYFVPDVRARDREISNARAWAEYAFHAVSTGGKQVPGKSYFIRHFSETKCENLAQVEPTIRSEHCVAVIERDRPERDAIHFVGISTHEKRFDVVTRLDEYGNANANLSEVTVVMTKKRYSKKSPPPEFRPLTEVVEAVAKHQAAGFSPSTTRDNIANPSAPRKGQPRTLLYVGRIYPVKALDNAIRAVAMMAQPIILRLVGPDQAGHMSELMSLCDQLHLPYTKPGEEKSAVNLNLQPQPKQVQFIGPKYDSDLDKEYWTCDGLILVSHTENFGATVVDAMAHGRAVITSTNTPWKTVADNHCGWWVDNAPESLAKTFDDWATLPDEKLHEMGDNGRQLVEREYTWPAIAASIGNHYKSCIRS